ncbi:MAG: retropepsin-like aspartic protease [Pseudomonadota bacterium]
MNTELPRTFKVVTVWLLIGLALFLAVQWGLHTQRQTRLRVDGEVLELRRSQDGHYHWPGHIDDEPVDFLIDTGATTSAMSAALATRLQLVSQGSVGAQTAGGVTRGQRVRADVRLRGGVTVERLTLTALPGLDSAPDQPLLGMDVLGKLRWSQHNGVLRVDLRQSASN